MELRLKIKELRLLDLAKDEFVSMVSHELRTLLTSVHGSLGLLKSAASSSIDLSSQQLLEIATRNTDRLLNIVNDILDLASMEARKMELRYKPTDLAKTARNAIERSESYCRKCGCEVTLLPAQETLPAVMADASRVLQVIINLISNAAKFASRNDTIEISVTALDNGVRVAVTDHGKGIQADQLNNLFKKFKQIGGGNAKLPGTGLGLNICKQIVELHHGRIGCESVPDERTTFYFTIPATQSKT